MNSAETTATKRGKTSLFLVVAAACVAPVSIAGCRELDRFSTQGDHFEGTVVAADFVRTGMAADTRMCMTIDADHLEDGPGQISTSDRLLQGAPLRPLPQLLNDPLSNFTFGDGHIKNLMYSVHVSPPSSSVPADGGLDAEADAAITAGATGATGATGAATKPSTLGDVLAVVALLQSNDVEVRLLRGAPELGTTAANGPENGSIFAVFPLTRKPGPCSF